MYTTSTLPLNRTHLPASYTSAAVASTITLYYLLLPHLLLLPRVYFCCRLSSSFVKRCVVAYAGFGGRPVATYAMLPRGVVSGIGSRHEWPEKPLTVFRLKTRGSSGSYGWEVCCEGNPSV